MGDVVTLTANTGADNQWWLLRPYNAETTLTSYVDWDYNMHPTNGGISLNKITGPGAFDRWFFEEVTPTPKLEAGYYRLYNQSAGGFLQSSSTSSLIIANGLDNFSRYQKFWVEQQADGRYIIKSDEYSGATYYVNIGGPDSRVTMSPVKSTYYIQENNGTYRILCNSHNQGAMGAEEGDQYASVLLYEGRDVEWLFLRVV